MKILSIVIIPWNSGLAAYAFDQARALRSAGHAVTFGCPEGSATAAFAAKEGFPVHLVPDHKHYLEFPGGFLRLLRFARSEGIDAVCAHTGLAQSLAWALRLFSPRLKVVRVKADVKNPSLGFTLSAVGKVISASAYIEKMYLAAGLPPARSALIRQGIEALPPAAPPAAPPCRVGLLGRLDPVKGHDCFLRAAAEVLRGGCPAEFHIAGAEANVKYAGLQKLAGELGIADKVKFHGRVEDTAAFMQGCHIGVIASLGSEAVSRAALEWLAAGRPLVSTSAGSLPEFTEAAWLVPPGDHKALAEKIAALAAAPAKAAELGARNRARAAGEFSKAAFDTATAGLFEAL